MKELNLMAIILTTFSFITPHAQSFVQKYSFNTSYPIAYVGDIDGDKIVEIIEHNSNRPDTLFIYSGQNGSIKYSVFNKGTLKIYDTALNGPKLLDYNNNGVKDLYLRNSTLKKMMIVDPSSQEILFEYGYKLADGIPNITAVTDMDDDGVLDILISEEDNTYGTTLTIHTVYSTGVPITSIKSVGSDVGNNYKLYNNYPNPFNPTTIIEYEITRPENVKINIYDVTGALVKELVNEQFNVGKYKAIWDGKDDSGNLVASGNYFYQIISGNFVQAKKMILLK